MDNLIFLDTEASGPAPGLPGSYLTEFGAVHYSTRQTFYGKLWDTTPIPFTADHAPSPIRQHGQVITAGGEFNWINSVEVFVAFKTWIENLCDGKRPQMVTDNLAFDWQWINYEFHRNIGENPLGFSGRRINDFYAGLVGDFKDQSAWKKLRMTSHTHNPVEDALGNAEAFERILNGERGR